MLAHQSLKDHMDIYLSKVTVEPSEDTLVVQMDFISNVMLDYPLASSSMHYNKPQITFFCSTVHFYDEEGIKRHKYLDFFSNYLSHNSEFVFHCLEQITYQFDGYRKISIVSDGADARFRNCYTNRSMPIFAFEKKMQFLWSILCPYHGKSRCDGHGGNLKQAYRLAVEGGLSLRNGEELVSWVNEVSLRLLRF
jgi:hypothetical protein